MRSTSFKYIFFILVVVINIWAHGQNIDSLMRIAAKPDADSLSVFALNSLSTKYLNEGNYSEAILYGNKAIELSRKIKDKKNLMKSLLNIGVLYIDKGDYLEAQKNLLQSLTLSEELGAEKQEAIIYNELGILNYSLHNYDQAINYHTLSIKISDKIKNNKNNVSNYLGLGDIFSDKGDFSKALLYYTKAQQVAANIGDKDNVAIAYNNMGTLFQSNNFFEKALIYYLKSAEIHQQIGNIENEAISYLNIAATYIKLKKYQEAEVYLKKGYVLSEQMGGREFLQELYRIQYGLDSIKNDYKSVFKHFKLYKIYGDSIENADVSKKIVQEQMQYTFDKKEAADKVIRDKKELLDAQEKKRQRLIMWFIIVAGIGASIAALLIFRSLQLNKKKNKIIELQKTEVEQKNTEIERKQKEIVDSITYAKRIQTSILPPLEDIKQAIPNSFILFKPKDIVSGDFYWFNKKNNYFFLAAADCTGHGVPGAFMSMLNMEKLTEALESTDTPGEILSLVNIGLKKALRQSDKEGASRDGMDIALLKIDTALNHIQYAGANRPLWLIRKNTNMVEETKATKVAIGGLTEDAQRFEEHSFYLQKGDTIYICSDGYADQFGKNDKKLMTKKFKEELLSIQHLSIEEQKKHLNDFIDDWKQGTEQTDDILVIGFRC
ncbi:MAG: tetratricopeptide repeat protein [Bacteroidetes bacterium]|nr:tetratricopeptide repeat protein [Bacteroidota bacterium]